MPRKVSNDKPTFHFDIDVLGNCNLRCPSCPVGNMPAQRSTGLMSPDLMRQIIAKATSECRVASVGLFNWTEPLLHPKLAEIVRVVRSHGIPCDLSSNLNVMPNLEDVLAANPTSLRVSLSGFNQEAYGVTHRGGDVEQVKQNMRRLAEAKSSMKSAVNLHVLFHRYLDNHEEEAQMRKFAESLGFDFSPVWAYLMPLEKNLALAGDTEIRVEFNDEDRRLVERLALDPLEAMSAMQPYKQSSCRLLEKQIALNSRAEVQLCCTTADQVKYRIASFLDTPIDEIQRLRTGHAMCARCTDKAMHVIAIYGGSGLEELAMARVRAKYPGVQLPPTITAPPPQRGWRRLKKQLRSWGGVSRPTAAH